MTIETPPAPVTTRPSFARTFQALRYRDYRLYWIALIISLLGVAFQNTAQRWLVYDITHSAFKLGIVGFISAAVAAPASIVGGILADRFSRRNLLIVTQALMILPPSGLALVIWLGHVQLWHIVVASSALGIIAAIDLPSRASLLPQLVAPDDLLNAQGLSSAVYQVTLIAGPALAALVFGAFGAALCFLFNGLSYAAMVVALFMMKPQPAAARDRRKGMRSTFVEGIRYILRTPMVLGLFAMIAAQGLLLNPYTYTILPVYVKDVLKMDVVGYGWLSSANGVGALLGALGLANMGKGRRGWLIIGGGLVMPAALLAFAWLQNFVAAMLVLVLLGMGTVLITTTANTALQLTVPDELRGRVNSLGTLIYLGGPQVGGLVFGYITERSNAPIALTVMAGLFLVSLVGIALIVPQVRHFE